MKTKDNLKALVSDTYDNIMIKRKRKVEVDKFKDPKRVAIYSKCQLTEEQKKEIDDVYVKNYGEKIPYIWHQHFTAFNGNFDKYYFPELLFVPELEKFLVGDLHYAKTLSDKNFLTMLAKSAGVKMPQTVFSCSMGVIQDANHNIVNSKELNKLSGEYFLKPTVDSCSGSGCQVIDIQNGIDKITNHKLITILNSKGNNWVIQERVKCHSSISAIYPNSVNTFRVMTYIWKEKICFVPCIMRIGQGGSNVDNAHAGGMFIAIDNDGQMHSKAFTEFKDEFTEHPDTHLIYGEHKIELFPKVLEAAEKLHLSVPQIGCINWDFTLDQNGEVILIEANIRGGSIWLFQMAHGKSIFGEKTPEILRWMKFMKSIKASQRGKYLYGKLPKKQ